MVCLMRLTLECINGNFVNTAVAKLSSEGAVTVDHFFLPTPDANGGRATWKYIQDGSTVTAKAQVLLKAPDPTKDIDWVLLDTTSTTPGFFGKVKHVIRANTCKVFIL
ncbi:hypothetical protein BC833DRAFT_609834 [Globomyces pollinis-pini]|nr:hypothetical protein BC833DRAFT_609834 [Globomyces pollinis-pini]